MVAGPPIGRAVLMRRVWFSGSFSGTLSRIKQPASVFVGAEER